MKRLIRSIDGPGPAWYVGPSSGVGRGSVKASVGKLMCSIGVHRWFHTPLDTLERVDARLVVPVLRAHQRAMEIVLERA